MARKTKIAEYSKRVIRLMIILWFIGAIYGTIVVSAEMCAALKSSDSYSAAVVVHLPELLTYIGAPVSGGIISYLIKSAYENREKIKHGNCEYRGFGDYQNGDI